MLQKRSSRALFQIPKQHSQYLASIQNLAQNQVFFGEKTLYQKILHQIENDFWLFYPFFGFIQGDFFNWASPGNVFRLAPPRNPSTGPPLNHQSMRITKHLDFLLSLGGASLGLYHFFEIGYLPANT